MPNSQVITPARLTHDIKFQKDFTLFNQKLKLKVRHDSNETNSESINTSNQTTLNKQTVLSSIIANNLKVNVEGNTNLKASLIASGNYEGKNVSVKIDVGYPASGGNRPSEFRVTTTIDGVINKLPPFKQ